MKNLKKNYLKKIFYILGKSNKNRVIFISILTVARSFFELLGISLLIPMMSLMLKKEIIDSKIKYYLPFLNQIDVNYAVLLFFSLFILVYFLKTIFIYFFNNYKIKFCNFLYVNLSNKILKNYLSKNYLFFLENNSSKLVRNISSETSIFSLGVIGNLIDIFAQLIIILSFIIFLLIFNINTIYIIASFIFMGILILNINIKKLRKWGEARQYHASQMVKNLNEVLGNIKEIIIYQKKKIFFNQIVNQIESHAKANFNKDILISIGAPVIEFLSVLTFFIFFIFLFLILKMNVNDLIILSGVFVFVSIKLIPSIINISRSFQALKYNYASVDVLYKELISLNKSAYPLAIKIYSNKINTLLFKNVDYSYYSKDKIFPIFKKINFNLVSGDKVAICGRTGSGKTTLLNLISGLIKPDNGEIFVNKKLIKTEEILQQIGYVSQNVYLSDDTILANIVFDNNIENININKITSILTSLELMNFINTLPNKLNTVVGERGSRLSGGQIQRIGIARAIYKNPSILILDEVTSSLDKKTEVNVLNEILSIMKDKIVIFSTHRPKVLSYCNKIFQIKDAKIILKKEKK